MKNLHDEHKRELSDCVEYIDLSIKKGNSYSEICNGLEIEFGSRYGYLRNIFSEYTPLSLNRYIKRRLLTVIYLKLKNSHTRISTRDEFFGLKNIPTIFRREFDLNINDDCSEDDLQPMLDIDELWEIHERLHQPFIRDYKVILGDKVKVDPDWNVITLILFEIKTYYLPTILLEDFDQFDDTEKILFLECFDKGFQEIGKTVEIKYDELEKAMVLAEWYNFNKPHYISNKAVIFAPLIPEGYKKIYYEIADCLLSNIKSGIPTALFDIETQKKIEAVSNSNTFYDLSNNLNMDITMAKELVWDLLCRGYLRYYVS